MSTTLGLLTGRAVFLAATILTATLPALAADTVSGQFTLGTKVLKPGAVAAFRIRDPSNAREMSTYVMLTQKPVQREAIARDLDPYAVAINDEAVREADYVSLFVRGNGEIGMNAHVGGTQYIDSTGSVLGQKGALVGTCETNTPDHVTCSVKVAAPVKSMNGPSWTIDVRFDAAVLSRPAGKRLPADGGDPGRALLDLVRAVQGNDLARIVALLTASKAENYQREYNTPAENLTEAKSMLGIQLPKSPRITGGELIDEATAVLEVEGTPFEGTKMLYLVEMRREKNRWVLGSSRPVGTLR